MSYTVKEIYLTLQGEGAHVGRVAAFCRFAGCNLWTGREQDRGRAVCRFCDTDFRGTDGPNGGKYTAGQLADLIEALWPTATDRMVVFTGGEPLLQLTDDLALAVRDAGFYVAIETNGTIERVPRGVDWVTLSPKAGAALRLYCCDELKLVYPQERLSPQALDHVAARVRSLQPMDGPDLDANTRAAVAHCFADPRWRLSLQTHKLIGLP